MTIADLFDSGFRKRNENHFAAIVRIAMSNGVISDEERAFLDRLAHNLDISQSDYAQIMEDYMSHPINPPITYERRLERLFDLTRMVWADHQITEKQETLLERFAIGLGFTPANSKYLTGKALDLVEEGVELDSFKEEIKNMNR